MSRDARHGASARASNLAWLAGPEAHASLENAHQLLSRCRSAEGLLTASLPPTGNPGGGAHEPTRLV